MAELSLSSLFELDLATSAWAREVVSVVGSQALEEAKRIAPVGTDESYGRPRRAGAKPRRPGGYKRAMHGGVMLGDVDGVRAVIYRLSNSNYKARWIEYGTAKMPPRQILHRAVAAVATSAVSTQ